MKLIALLALPLLALTACDKPAQTAVPQPASEQTADASAAGPAPQHGMVTSNAIVIVNSGATNLIGWRITIGANGDASYVTGDGPGNATLPADVFAKLRGDIDAAKPLANIPQEQPCMKPMSFGTKLSIAVGGDRSPDLSCPTNDAGQALQDDVNAVATFLKIRNTPRSQGKELPPQNE